MTRPAMAILAFLFICATAHAADDAPAKGAPLAARWEYSMDGGKSFSPDPPVINAERVPDPKKHSVVARATFEIADPAAIGLLKLLVGAGDGGGVALTDAESIDRYNVGTRPNLTMMKLVLNGKETDAGLDPYTLYRYAPIDPALLKKGPNTLTVTGVYWFQLASPMPGTLRFETLPPTVADLDRTPVLGAIGEDYFSLTARSVIPANFTVGVTPTDPPGKEERHALPRGRWLKARIPVAKGAKALRYSLTVQTGGASKTYGPYEVKMPTFGEGFRFVVAGNTAVYQGHAERFKTFLDKLLAVRPDVFVHIGNYVDIPPWDWMWTDCFFSVSPKTLAQIPMLPLCGSGEMMSPVAFSRQFYFPSDDKDFGHWTAVYGKVRFVAIETWSQSQAKDPAAAAAWLDDILRQAKEEYVIVLNHQVSHCSTPNASRLFRPALQHTAKYIDPILVKNKVTLTIGGHHTQYERVEPPAAEGAPTILTCMAGGSGKPLHQGYVDANKNSKASHQGDHYCLFEVKGGKLLMQAIDFDGKVFDTREFAPRK